MSKIIRKGSRIDFFYFFFPFVRNTKPNLKIERYPSTFPLRIV